LNQDLIAHHAVDWEDQLCRVAARVRAHALKNVPRQQQRFWKQNGSLKKVRDPS
jgi:hypothetical protein